jgi:hypothetical protein
MEEPHRLMSFAAAAPVNVPGCSCGLGTDTADERHLLELLAESANGNGIRQPENG